MCVLVGVAAVEGGPSISLSFRATVTIRGPPESCLYAPDGNCSAFPTVLIQDDENMRSATLSSSLDKYAPAAYRGTPREWFNYSVVDFRNESFYSMNDLCYPYPGKGYSNIFSWLDRATFAGTEKVLGINCELWRWANRYLLALSEDNIPVVLNTTEPSRGNVVSYEFLTFEEGVDGDFFNKDWESMCYSPPTCGDDPRVITEDVFVFHPEDSFDVVNQDVADERGDVFFVCEDLLSGGGKNVFDHNYALISQYKLRRLGTIGQYRNCNGYPPFCSGKNDYYVGREAALGLGFPNAGQCTPNIPTGSWFSLPAGGHCSSSTTPSNVLGVDCTWEIVSRVKTINGSCLFVDLGFHDLCALDGKAPFLRAEEAFSHAFADDGCPSLTPPFESFNRKPLLL